MALIKGSDHKNIQDIIPTMYYYRILDPLKWINDLREEILQCFATEECLRSLSCLS